MVQSAANRSPDLQAPHKSRRGLTSMAGHCAMLGTDIRQGGQRCRQFADNNHRRQRRRICANLPVARFRAFSSNTLIPAPISGNVAREPHGPRTNEPRQRVMVDVSSRDTSTAVIGEKVSFPLALAPVGRMGLCGHACREVTARGSFRVASTYAASARNGPDCCSQ